MMKGFCFSACWSFCLTRDSFGYDSFSFWSSLLSCRFSLLGLFVMFAGMLPANGGGVLGGLDRVVLNS